MGKKLRSRNHSLYSVLAGSPLFYLLLGGIPAVILIYYQLSLANLYYFLIICLVLGLVCFVVLLFRRPGRILLVVLGFAGFGIYATATFYPYLVNRGVIHGERHLLEGTTSGDGIYRIERLDGERFSGAVLLLAEDIDEDVPPRSEIALRLTGVVEWPQGRPGFSTYLRKNRLLGVLRLKELHSMQEISSSESRLAGRIANFVDSSYRSFEVFYPLSAAFTRALFFGEREALPPRVDQLLRNLGLSHLFVISGLHVGFLFLWLDWIIPKFGPGKRFFVFLLLFFLYLQMIGWAVSALRAVVMVLLFCLTRLFNRRLGGANFLTGALFILLLIDPFVIFNVAFQLTFAATAGIFAVHPYTKIIPDRLVLRAFIYNAGAFLAVSPLVLYHFNYLPLWGVFFSYMAGLCFPFFILLLIVQNLFFWTGWSFFAGAIEDFLTLPVDFFGRTVFAGNYLTTIGGISLYITLLIGAAIWLLLDYRRRWWLRSVAFVVLMFLLAGVMLPAVRPHLEHSMVGSVPVALLRPSGENVVLLVPRQVRLDRYRVRLINRHLRRRGVRLLAAVISEYRRESWVKLGFVPPMGKVLTYHEESETVSLPSGRYDFTEHKLYSNFAEISYNNPLAEESFRYNPRAITAFTGGKLVMIDQLERLAETEFKALREAGWKIQLLAENPLLLTEAGIAGSYEELIFYIGLPGSEANFF